MSERPNPTLQQLAEQLRTQYERAWGRIKNDEQRLLEDWSALNRDRRLARLRELEAEVTALMDQSDDLAVRFSTSELPGAYTLGATTTATLLGTEPTFAQTDIDAVNEIVASTHSNLLQATRFVKRSTKDLIRTLTKDHLADKLIRGQTATQAARNLTDELAGHGITAVVYKNGAHVGLGTYADMVTRTVSAEAYQVGGLNQGKAHGAEFFELFDGPDCGLDGHDSFPKADGLVIPTDQALSYPISHPNCVRTSVPRLDIKSLSEAADAQPSTTAAQRADQAHVSRQRELAVAQRAAAKRLDAQVTRRANGLLADTTNRVTSPAAARALARRQLLTEKRTRRSA